MEGKERNKEDDRRLSALIVEAIQTGTLAHDVNFEDFNYLLRNGGRLTQTNVPYTDKCFLHKLVVRAKTGLEYRFKTLTTEEQNFSV